MKSSEELGRESAFPSNILFNSNLNGCTKRELFAAMAMQGILANDNNNEFTASGAAFSAIEYADALLAELAKEKK